MADSFIFTPRESPQPRVESRHQQTVSIVVAIVTIMLLGGLSFILYSRFTKQLQPVVTAPIPLPTIIAPSPVRQIPAVATQSAFLRLDSSVASLTGAISAYSVEDPSLSPPVLEVPLPIPR